VKALSNLSKTLPYYVKEPSSMVFYCITNNLKDQEISRHSPREDFSVLISITLVNDLTLFFICPFDNYHTIFLTLSLISITTSLLEVEILQISSSQALNSQ